MKKIIIIILAMAATAINANAQEIFKTIFESSNKTLNDTKEDVSVRKIALFKVDALTYLNTKVLEQMSDTTHTLSPDEMMTLIVKRDSQAYYMYDYINLFIKEYSRAKKQHEKDNVMKIFRDASINFPLFNEPNREFVLAYYNRQDFLTQFSLDTDWVRANADVRRRLRGK